MADQIEQDQVNQTIAEAACDVVETMFFTSIVEENEPPDPAASAAGLATKVEFRGEPAGAFRVRLLHPVASAMAGVFLSADEEELSDDQINGVMGELTNMIAGAALSRLDPKGKFRLQSPESMTELAVPAGKRVGSCSLPLECGWLHVDLWVE